MNESCMSMLHFVPNLGHCTCCVTSISGGCPLMEPHWPSGQQHMATKHRPTSVESAVSVAWGAGAHLWASWRIDESPSQRLWKNSTTTSASSTAVLTIISKLICFNQQNGSLVCQINSHWWLPDVQEEFQVSRPKSNFSLKDGSNNSGWVPMLACVANEGVSPWIKSQRGWKNWLAWSQRRIVDRVNVDERTMWAMWSCKEEGLGSHDANEFWWFADEWREDAWIGWSQVPAKWRQWWKSMVKPGGLVEQKEELAMGLTLTRKLKRNWLGANKRRETVTAAPSTNKCIDEWIVDRININNRGVQLS